MLSVAEVYNLLHTPKAVEIEEQFVEVMHEKRARAQVCTASTDKPRKRQVNTQTYSLKTFLSLLARDLLMSEISKTLQVHEEELAKIYDSFDLGRAFFGGEDRSMRHRRILTARHDVRVHELRKRPLQTPLLREIADRAGSMGCVVRPHVQNAERNEDGTYGSIRIVTGIVDIDGVACTLRVTEHIDRPNTTCPRVCFKFIEECVLVTPVTILCVRVPGHKIVDYVVPSHTLYSLAYPEKGCRHGRLLIALGRKPCRDTFDMRPFKNRYSDIKKYV